MTFVELPSQSVAVCAFKFFQDQLTNRSRGYLFFINLHKLLSSSCRQFDSSPASSPI